MEEDEEENEWDDDEMEVEDDEDDVEEVLTDKNNPHSKRLKKSKVKSPSKANSNSATQKRRKMQWQ